jgi:hypothetical protein
MAACCLFDNLEVLPGAMGLDETRPALANHAGHLKE